MSGSGWAQDRGAVVAAWNSLRALAPQTLAAQFAADPARVEAMTRHIGWPVAPGSAAEACMRIDFSKTHLGEAELAAFEALAEAAGFAAARAALFDGGIVNVTEGRAATHGALRGSGTAAQVDEAEALLARMGMLVEAIHEGALGEIRHCIAIGIGGSALGPALAIDALTRDLALVDVHVVSNIDGLALEQAFVACDPQTTLVALASKTFTTIETMTNAQTAKAWMARRVRDPAAQFAAVSTAADRTAAFGIDPARVFGFEDWVGGRYSIWGPIGLPLMLAVGPEQFDRFLAGGAAMDRHFRTAPFAQNLPVLLALVGIWHNQGCGYATRAVLPYDQRLSRLPAYLQQLEMESNGKRVAMDGGDLPVNSGPVVWGEPGTNGQHAFYQLIHQGTRVIPCEFLLAKTGHEPDLAHQHLLLAANCLAQSEALLRGRSLDEARAILARKGLAGAELDRQARHRVFPGNRPSTTLAYDRLDPFTLGRIIALYEHRVFVEGVILGINSFDQWGVELGKELALALQPILEGRESADGKDGSTRALVAWLTT